MCDVSRALNRLFLCLDFISAGGIDFRGRA